MKGIGVGFLGVSPLPFEERPYPLDLQDHLVLGDKISQVGFILFFFGGRWSRGLLGFIDGGNFHKGYPGPVLVILFVLQSPELREFLEEVIDI